MIFKPTWGGVVLGRKGFALLLMHGIDDYDSLEGSDTVVVNRPAPADEGSSTWVRCSICRGNFEIKTRYLSVWRWLRLIIPTVMLALGWWYATINPDFILISSLVASSFGMILALAYEISQDWYSVYEMGLRVYGHRLVRVRR